MRSSLLCRVFVVALAFFPWPAAAALEVWLASTSRCNACSLYDDIDDLRRYGETLHYQGSRGDLEIPIRIVRKRDLPTDIVAGLEDDIGPGSGYWDEQLIVLVVRDGKLLFAGNIAESGDLNAMKYSPAVMSPPAEPEDDDPALDDESPYYGYFLHHWNLEYFVAVALGDRARYESDALLNLQSDAPWPIGRAEVILWGSAATPLGNPLFISRRIEEIRTGISRLPIPDLSFVTLYGDGPVRGGNDTSFERDGRITFGPVPLRTDLDASIASLGRVFSGVVRAPDPRVLIVQVGHSGPAGSPLWGDMRDLNADDLGSVLDAASGSLVMVSGACMSGQFATAVSCGFFAAHPEVLASGCQRSSTAIEASDDYLKHFFSAATRPSALVPDMPVASMTEAHWYAADRLEDHQVAYTSTDALIDMWFDAHPDRLPARLTVTDIQALADRLTGVERHALEELTAGKKPGLVVRLDNMLALNQSAEDLLEDATELTSDERNRIIHLKYKLMLVMLARRAAYRSLAIDDAHFAEVEACESQSLTGYLGREPRVGASGSPARGG